MYNVSQFDRVKPDADGGGSDSEGTHFVAEAAELRLKPGIHSVRFILQDCPMPGMHRLFSLVGSDKSGEDIAGWRYEEIAGPNKGNTSYKDPGRAVPCQPLTVLIIND